MRHRNGIRAIAAPAVVAVGALVALVPTDAAFADGINPIFCGKGTVLPVSAPAAGGLTQARSAKANPYRVVATYYYKARKQPQDKRAMRLGTLKWGFTHIKAGRHWGTKDTLVIVGCVLTCGEPVGPPLGSRQLHVSSNDADRDRRPLFARDLDELSGSLHYFNCRTRRRGCHRPPVRCCLVAQYSWNRMLWAIGGLVPRPFAS